MGCVCSSVTVHGKKYLGEDKRMGRVLYSFAVL